jgi:hypothetical protein
MDEKGQTQILSSSFVFFLHVESLFGWLPEWRVGGAVRQCTAWKIGRLRFLVLLQKDGQQTNALSAKNTVHYQTFLLHVSKKPAQVFPLQ